MHSKDMCKAAGISLKVSLLLQSEEYHPLILKNEKHMKKNTQRYQVESLNQEYKEIYDLN